MLGEITMLQQLKHRNIMRLYDWWFDKQHQVGGSNSTLAVASCKQAQQQQREVHSSWKHAAAGSTQQREAHSKALLGV
jgi:hypothetical protein